MSNNYEVYIREEEIFGQDATLIQVCYLDSTYTIPNITFSN